MSRHPATRIGAIVAIMSLLHVSAAHAQTVPFIGSIIWTHNGYDSAAQRFRDIEALDQASHAGVIIIGTNTATNNVPFERKRVGEILTLDAATGRLERADTVCPQFSKPGDLVSLRTATIDDSATVICYTCYADGVHLATWPDLVPIVDTMLRGWQGAWLSNTGRYMILQQGDIQYYAYDRLTGDTVRLPEDVMTYATYNGPEFTADDKYVLMHRSDQNATQLHVLDLENMHAQAKVFRVGEWSYMQLSYRGNKLLYAADGAVGVIDVETGERIWGISEGEYPIFNLFISADGSEVFLLRDAAAASPKYGSLAILRYHPPSVDPDGILAPGEMDPGSLWIASPEYPQPKIPGKFLTVKLTTTVAGYFSHETRTGVPEDSDPFVPILYPNPATSSVTMQVGACTDASWVVTIHDQSGSRVLERTVACQSGALRFDVSGLSAGSYVVRAMVPMSRHMASAMLIVR